MSKKLFALQCLLEKKINKNLTDEAKARNKGAEMFPCLRLTKGEKMIEEKDKKTNQERFENIYLGFWELVAKEFPNIKTGDYEPLQVLDFQRQMKKHVKQWVIQNNTEGEYIDF